MEPIRYGNGMDNVIAALEKIAAELERINKEGITVWGGSTLEEN